MSLDVKIHPVLYSVGTELAYRIEKNYYNDVHYVWCTESFDLEAQPATSRPAEICRRFLMQLSTGDLHAHEIIDNKRNILVGANVKFKDGIIDKTKYEEIKNIVASAEFYGFFPVIYIIDSKKVEEQCKEVAAEDRASLSSVEYIIEDLKPDEYQMIFTRNFLDGVITPADGIVP